MTLKNIFFTSFLLFIQLACAQKASIRPHCEDKTFDKTLALMLHFSVPVIGVKELSEHRQEYVLLDAREVKEYEVSHIEGAKNVGYDHFLLENVANLDKKTPIVVYCSVGYRSEKIGEKLKAAGFSDVKNLYGSIFEWVNQGLPVVASDNKPIAKVHTYNKLWSRWVKSKNIEKVY
jgi:rhodanese-related sulfurtransferase